MDPVPVNFADGQRGAGPQPRFRSHFGLLGLSVLCSVILLGLAYLAVAGGSISRITNRPFLEQLSRLVTSRDRALTGEADDRVNILLLGMGGAGHEGAYLADTIILASLKPSTHQVAMLSIPRDLAVDIPDNGTRKINAANAIGRDADYPGGGERLTAEIVGQLTNLPIQYVARIDFRGFEKLINDVGGVEVTVERSFTDREYPTTNFGYQTVSFTTGPQRMNGATALKYVRSRHGNNGEGSDFARARRQQKVLAALKGKLFSLSLLTSPTRLASVLGTFGDHARTDLEIWEMLRLTTLLREASDDVLTKVLDTTPEGLLSAATGIDGAALLVPRSGDYREVQALAQNIFSLPDILRERPTIAVDATRDRRLGDAISTNLAAYDATVIRLTTTVPASSQTVVYDLSGGAKPFTHRALVDAYQTVIADSLSGEDRTALAGRQVDFLIVIGRPGAAAAAPAKTPRSS